MLQVTASAHLADFRSWIGGGCRLSARS